MSYYEMGRLDAKLGHEPALLQNKEYMRGYNSYHAEKSDYLIGMQLYC